MYICKAVRGEDGVQSRVLKGSETVLLVDDEAIVADVGKQLLERLGYTVLVAGNGRDALSGYEQNRSSIDLVVLDLVMPEMSGGETFDRLKALDPDVTVILSSGYSLNGQATKILERGCNAFIQKPFNIKELSKKMRVILD